ncbi:hypothetical protein Hanom_Chr15g01364931 [Helianthus anomalus]
MWFIEGDLSTYFYFLCITTIFILTNYLGVQTSRAEPKLDQAQVRARARLTYESSSSARR